MMARRFVLLLALAALLQGRGLLSGTDVRVDETGRVIVRATSVPLTDVLNRFSQATGTKVVYDAAKPRQLVTVEIRAASQAEALSQLLEGQGLSYAFRMDAEGRGVDMLFLMAKGQAAASKAPPSAPAPVDRQEAFEQIEDAAAEAEANLPDVQEGEPVPESPIDPGVGAPAPGAAPGANVPTILAPGAPGSTAATPFSAPWQASAPAFPQSASYPSWR